MRRATLTLAAIAACHAVAGAACDFGAVDAAVNDLLLQRPALQGVGLMIVKGDTVLYERYFRSYGPATVVPIASSTKWLSAATLMALWDEGRFGLDQPVATVLPQFTGMKGTMTVRQLFSHTSGLPGNSVYENDQTLTLEQAVDLIAANVNLVSPPGTAFRYGGVSMQVGGRLAEALAGRPWAEVFQARIAAPLGMSVTNYDGLGPTLNPMIGGGAQSSLRDYARLVQMLKDGGRYRGVQVLSSQAVEEIHRDQTNGVPMEFAPVDGVRYGLGTWREIVAPDGTLIEGTDPGAFGFTPWINFENDFYGVFMVRNIRQNVVETIDEVRQIVRDEIARCYRNLSGRALLDGWSTTTAGEPYELEVTTLSGAHVARVSGLFEEGGRFRASLAFDPGTYRLRLKSPKFLAGAVVSQIGTANVTNLTFSLLAGDVDDDNRVDLDDFLILAASYELGTADPAFDARTDLDGSGRTDLDDFLLLASNYGRTGAP